MLNDNALLQAVCDTGTTDALDNAVAAFFPNGCDIAELAESFNTEGRFIANDLGIADEYRKLRVELGYEKEMVYDFGDICIAFGQHKVVVSGVRNGKDGDSRIYDVKSVEGEDEWVGLDWYDLEPAED